jgi:hypothetical protein
MTTESSQPTITDADVEAFASRLDTWAKELPANEAAVLSMILQRATGADTADTAGFGPGPNVFDLACTLGRGNIAPWAPGRPPAGWERDAPHSETKNI